MKKSRGILVLVCSVILMGFLGFVAAVGIGKTGTGSAKNIKLGLDLAGGVSITYQAVGDNPSSEDMSDTIYKLQKRVEGYSTEASVYQEGSNRINVEIPGVSDANQILEDLGKPGSLTFQTQNGDTVLEGTDVASAQAVVDTTSNNTSTAYMVDLSLTDEGAEKFATATTENIGQIIYIYYDGEVISSPTVNSTITGGKAQITGMESNEAAETLASTIRIGSLSLELEEVRSNVVGAQLGEEAISTSVKAAMIGVAIILVFLCIVYLLAGLASSISLGIYIGIVLVALNAFDMTLTLPGIAGIILSIGMAVDANVIIFARVKEELGEGKSVKLALKEGFSKATSAIVDGNVTTLIAALVLGLKGSGTVKGFAQTLALGIVVSMFTALVVTRLIVYAFYAVGLRDAKFFGSQKPRKTINFLGKRKIVFAVSILMIASGVAGMVVNQSKGNDILNYSLEFKGGTSSTVTFDKDYSISEIDSDIVPYVEEITGDGNVQAQKVAGSNDVIIKTRSLDLEERKQFTEVMNDKFGIEESDINAETISSTVSSEVRMDAFIAVLIATACMLIYIWFRFKDIRFAGSAVLALVHDVLVVLAFYAIARVSVGSTFIACMLTIVGYSINATIVIFDRIREKLKVAGKNQSIKALVNESITDTLTRSIYTSFTTFVAIAALYVLGVSSIKEFALPLMVGIICGAYSSVFLTGALWFIMKGKAVREEADQPVITEKAPEEGKEKKKKKRKRRR